MSRGVSDAEATAGAADVVADVTAVTFVGKEMLVSDAELVAAALKAGEGADVVPVVDSSEPVVAAGAAKLNPVDEVTAVTAAAGFAPNERTGTAGAAADTLVVVAAVDTAVGNEKPVRDGAADETGVGAEDRTGAAGVTVAAGNRVDTDEAGEGADAVANEKVGADCVAGGAADVDAVGAADG